ncbi:MAG: radical SAM protein [Planctomycetota bacterium]|nr:MAG: radical SAM protein [Planctomycetota bacterium]
MTDPETMTDSRNHGTMIFEVTQKCNHDCLHCYNVWKNPAPYPTGELGTDETLAMLSKLLDETGATSVTLTGGEPLLRKDIFDIVDFLDEKNVSVNLITNGTLLNEKTIGRFGSKIDVYELPLLSVEAEIHDRMSGSAGAFDKVTMAIADLKTAGAKIVTVFVATKLNLDTWPETAELAFALGVDAIMFNRFNPGGEGFKNFDMLQATPEQLSRALDHADGFSKEYEMPISCSIAMPPCLFETSKYENLTFGFCAAGTERAYYTLDPLGNLRPCNHSATILGNIRETGFWEMADGGLMKDFTAACPEFCSGCRLERECLGGCKAAAEVCIGSPADLDPFIAAFRNEARPLKTP